MEGTVLLTGQPGDTLQAENAARSQDQLDAESRQEWMPGLGCASKKPSLLSFALLRLAQDHFLPTLFFALSPVWNDKS